MALETLSECMKRYPISIHGFVIMPNHVHLLMTGQDQRLVSKFVGIFKEFTAKKIINWCFANNEERLLTLFSDAAVASKQGHKFQVWQKRFDNVAIIRKEDFLIKLNYIHNNPMQERWRLCATAEEYPFSSARYYTDDVDVGFPVVNIENGSVRSPVDG